MFKRWSKISNEANKELNPELGLRKWDELTTDEKHRIWKHLEQYFFEPEIIEEYKYGGSRSYYEFEDKSGVTQRVIHLSIMLFNRDYKAKNYTSHYLENNSLTSACRDFREIFMKQS